MSEYIINGIKCDSCDWDDMSVRYENYKEWLNRPCPECGANLLTRSDYLLCKSLIAVSKAFGAKMGDPEAPKPEGAVDIHLGMNGTGQISNIEIES